jgi:hypothetical protein
MRPFLDATMPVRSTIRRSVAHDEADRFRRTALPRAVVAAVAAEPARRRAYSVTTRCGVQVGVPGLSGFVRLAR